MVGNTTQVAAAIHEGSAELGSAEGAVDDPALESRVVARDQLVIVVGPDHPWATRVVVTPDRLPENVLRHRERYRSQAVEALLALIVG